MIRILKSIVASALIALFAVALAHHGPRFFAGPITSPYVAASPVLAQVGGADAAMAERTSNARLPSGAYGPTFTH